MVERELRMTANKFLRFGGVKIKKNRVSLLKNDKEYRQCESQKILVSNEFSYGKNKETDKKYFLRFKSCKNKWTVIHRASVNGRICL